MAAKAGYSWGYRRPQIRRLLSRRKVKGSTVNDVAAELGINNRAAADQLVRMERDHEVRRVRGLSRRDPDRWYVLGG